MRNGFLLQVCDSPKDKAFTLYLRNCETHVFYFFLGVWIQTTSSIVKRFEEVTINITSLSSKLQTVLVTVLNFKDGLDSMHKWCEQTRKMFERLTTVSFDIYILHQQIREIKVCKVYTFSQLCRVFLFAFLYKEVW